MEISAGTARPRPFRRRNTPGLGTAVAFMAPALILYSFFTVGPLISAGMFSVFRWEGVRRSSFAGAGNFRELYDTGPLRREILRGFRHNVMFFVGTMLVQNTLGFALGVLLHRNRAGKRFFQTVIALPFLVNPLVIGYAWTLLLNPNYGPVSAALRGIGAEGFIRPWLGDPNWAGPLVILINAWQWVGFPMLVFGAALATIPEEFESAAMVDGANGWQVLRLVKMPLLIPAFGTITMLTFIGSFNAFNLQYSIGGVQGAPSGSTDVLGLVFYRLAFGSGLNAIGLSSALAALTFLFVFGSAVVLRRFLLRAEDRIS